MSVSVIVPVFNGEAYVSGLVTTLLTNLTVDAEIIVVDDSSNDTTVSILVEMGKSDPRIKVITDECDENRGAQYCRNIGLSVAKKDLVMFLDVDDFVVAGLIDGRYESHLLAGNSDFSVFRTGFCDFNDKLAERPYWPDNRKSLIKLLLHGEAPAAGWSLILKRGFAEKVSWNEDLKIYQDFYFILDCVRLTEDWSIISSENSDYFYRRGHSSDTVSSDTRVVELFPHIIENFRNYSSTCKVIYGYTFRKEIRLFLNKVYYQLIRQRAKTILEDQFISVVHRCVISSANKFSHRKTRVLIYSILAVFFLRDSRFIVNLLKKGVDKIFK